MLNSFAVTGTALYWIGGLVVSCRVRLFEASAVGAGLAEGVSQFVARKTFANVLRHGTVQNFGEGLRADIAQGDLSAMVQATGYNAPVVENGHMRIQGVACAF